MRFFLLLVFSLVTVALMAGSAVAIAPSQVDDFENGTVMLWSEGGPSPNPPVNIADGGPAGAGDNYLSNSSTGVGREGSRMAMFNGAQWTGDYVSADVVRIEMDLANFGATDLPIRVAFQSGTTRYGSGAFNLVADGLWYHAEFDLNALSLISGTATLEEVMGAVAVMRIISAAAPSWQGDSIAAEIGVDNITAIQGIVPVEAATWGGIKRLYDGR